MASLAFIFVGKSKDGSDAIAVDVQEIENGDRLDDMVADVKKLENNKSTYYPNDMIYREDLVAILGQQRIDYPALRPLVAYMLSGGAIMGSTPRFTPSVGPVPSSIYNGYMSWVNAFLSVGAVGLSECSQDILAQISPEVSGMYGARCVLAEEVDSLMVDMFNLGNPRTIISEMTLGYFVAGGVGVGVYAVNGGVEYNLEYIIEGVEKNGDQLIVKFAQVKFDQAPMDGRPWNITDRFEVVVQDLGSGRIRLISVGE